MVLNYTSLWTDVINTMAAWSLIHSAGDAGVFVVYYEALVGQHTSTSVFSTNMVEHNRNVIF